MCALNCDYSDTYVYPIVITQISMCAPNCDYCNSYVFTQLWLFRSLCVPPTVITRAQTEHKVKDKALFYIGFKKAINISFKLSVTNDMRVDIDLVRPSPHMDLHCDYSDTPLP